MTTPATQAAQARLAAVVSIAAAVLWMAAQWLGPLLGLPGHYSILFDLMALAAFGFSMVVTYRLSRAARAQRPKKQG